MQASEILWLEVHEYMWSVQELIVLKPMQNIPFFSYSSQDTV